MSVAVEQNEYPLNHLSVCSDLAMLPCPLRPCRVRPSSMIITLPRLTLLSISTTYQAIRARHGF